MQRSLHCSVLPSSQMPGMRTVTAAFFSQPRSTTFRKAQHRPTHSVTLLPAAIDLARTSMKAPTRARGFASDSHVIASAKNPLFSKLRRLRNESARKKMQVCGVLGLLSIPTLHSHSPILSFKVLPPLLFPDHQSGGKPRFGNRPCCWLEA